MSHHSRVLTAAELRNAVPHVAPATRLAITFLFLATLAVPGNVKVPLHVSTEGDDGWSGQRDTPNDNRTDGPLASLQRAVSLSRQARGRSNAAADRDPRGALLSRPVARPWSGRLRPGNRGGREREGHHLRWTTDSRLASYW